MSEQDRAALQANKLQKLQKLKRKCAEEMGHDPSSMEFAEWRREVKVRKKAANSTQQQHGAAANPTTACEQGCPSLRQTTVPPEREVRVSIVGPCAEYDKFTQIKFSGVPARQAPTEAPTRPPSKKFWMQAADLNGKQWTLESFTQLVVSKVSNLSIEQCHGVS
mmetsp:Transcript_30522/g.50556  ORF Transcript_30522/g.50556 Transcript_30522/m.50556 type:complete len:164 (-) Transcript_30522:66-557(-)|eukprot:CAMPEP_0119311378 /NCGR_PEP_ID=MMETSP1333-20130426/22187_1 /TAXON_ID=418940 /ORGANISM="Scyphosphaera apsteinii, Strain RCC1455" /LENGTH=163 /DNA_ID=CAMNT_0007315737 /DNA_START=189 /DNA_END=680 /DNA_ORIENTATION=+